MRRPYEAPEIRKRGIPELVIYHVPSSDPAHSWSVYRAGKSILLHTTRWDQGADARRISDAMRGMPPPSTAPTLVESTCEMDGAWWEDALSRFAGFRISLATQRVVGLDGEIYGIHRPMQFELEWWCDGPIEWTDISRWTRECISRFRSEPTQS